MLAPRFRSLARPSMRGAKRCLQHQWIRTTPRITFRQAISERRHASSQSATRSAQVLFRRYPISVSAAFAFILFGAGTLLYSNYIYNTYIIGVFHNFPDPVAKPLRRALYYTNISLSPNDAIKYYKEALRVADEIGMDPFSDEILGVKIQLAALMEKIQQYKKAIDVLEIVRRDCLKWVDELGSVPGNEGKRTKVLAKTVGISVKLGELYANEYVADKGLAEEKLVWAVTTVLKEQRRRETEGVKSEEGQWMSPEEIGGAMEALAHHYEEKDQHYLAAPLFLQAINLSPPSSCHTAILMNNLSTALAQQSIHSEPGLPPPSRSALISNSREWAIKALAVSRRATPPERTEECDVACATATHNLGEFAEMDGNVAEARRRYEEARSLAAAIGFREGVAQGEEALKRLSKT